MNCGSCCKDLVVTIDRIASGLYLLPNELALFSDDIVFPCIGLDNSANLFNPEFIALYQMTANNCLYLTEGNKCGIYDKRPLVCRSFPLTLPQSKEISVPLISKKCRFMSKYSRRGKVAKVDFSGPEEERAFGEISRYFKEVLGKYRWIRFFDFRTKLWSAQVPVIT
jgi:Fe-S-cluster containining protein